MFRWFQALYVSNVIRISSFDWGLVNTIFIAVMIISGFPLGKLIDKIPRKKAVLLAYFLFVPASFLFILCRSFAQVVLVFIVFAIGGSLLYPAYGALMADMIPREKRGRIMGTIGTLNVMASVPASVLAGVLYSLNPAYPFALTIFLGVAVSLIVFLAVQEPKVREK
jgi:MFS family permease